MCQKNLCRRSAAQVPLSLATRGLRPGLTSCRRFAAQFRTAIRPLFTASLGKDAHRMLNPCPSKVPQTSQVLLQELHGALAGIQKLHAVEDVARAGIELDLVW